MTLSAALPILICLAAAPMDAERAQRLLQIGSELTQLETAALHADADYTQAVQRKDEVQRMLVEHRATFEATRDADADYVSAQQTVAQAQVAFDRAKAQQAESQTALRDAEQRSHKNTAVLSKGRPMLKRIDADIAAKQAHIVRMNEEMRESAAEAREGRGVYDSKHAAIRYVSEQINELETQRAAIAPEIESAERTQADAAEQARAAAEDLKNASAALRDRSHEFAQAQKSFEPIHRDWESRYTRDPATVALLTQQDEAATKADQAHKAVLSRLASDPRWRALAQERDHLNAQQRQ